MTGTYLDADAYVQIRIATNTWRREARAVRVTQRRPDPANVLPGCVVVKLRIRLPDAAFRPLEPEAVVTVPEDLVQHPVEVEAAQP